MNLDALAADAYGHVMGGGKYFDQRIDEQTRVFAMLSDVGFELVLWAHKEPYGLWVTWRLGKTGKLDVTPSSIATWLRSQIEPPTPCFGMGFVQEMLERQGQNPGDTSEKLALEPSA